MSAEDNNRLLLLKPDPDLGPTQAPAAVAPAAAVAAAAAAVVFDIYL